MKNNINLDDISDEEINYEDLDIDVDENENESCLDFYDRTFLEEQEINQNFKSIYNFHFIGVNLEELDLKQFVKEIIETMKENKKRCEKRLYSIPDVKRFSDVEIDNMYLQLKESGELKAVLREVYTTRERSKALMKSLRKSYVSGSLVLGLRDDSDNVRYMVIDNVIRKKIKKINALIDERLHIIGNDLRKMNSIKDKIGYQSDNYSEYKGLIESLFFDSFIKELLEEKVKLFCEEEEKKRIIKEKERLIKQEQREQELKEKRERERKEKEELERLKELEDKNDSKEEVKLFDINGYEYIRKIIDDYEFIFPDGILDLNIEDSFNYEELRQIINFDFMDIDDDIFITTFLTLLSKIDKADDNIREKLASYVKVLCVKYELYCRVKNIVDDVNNAKMMPYLTKEEVELLNSFTGNLNELKYCNNSLLVIKLLDRMQEILYNIKNNNRVKNISREKAVVKSFVLFDYKLDENGCKKAYVVTDLDVNNSDNMIDDSIDQEKIVSCGYNDFNELIDDILLLGNAEIMTQPNDKSHKLIRSVYYSSGYNKPIDNKKENATGMRRIRPRMTSYLRFIDEMVLFIPGTKKYMQIRSLLESKMLGLRLDEAKPFGIFINYLDAFKRKDIDAYTIAKKRQKNSELRNVLKKPCDEFSSEDLVILSDAIDVTLDSFDTLKNISNNFDFGVINQIKNNDWKKI